MGEIYNAILFQPLLNLLVFFSNLMPGHDMGLAIILLTIVVRALLIPLSQKALKSQKALQELQPRIDELRKKYTDKKEQSQELMKFYQENKINPFSSCLPLIIQLPILFALYQVFRVGLTTDSFQYLYPFVAHPETINATLLGFFSLSAANPVLAVLAGGLQFVQSKMLMNQQPKRKAVDKTGEMATNLNKQMTYLMPAMTVFIAWGLPSGLSLYWVATTLFAIAQQWVVFRKKKPTKQS